MRKFQNVSFDSQYIYAEDATGKRFRQSLLWYPALLNASPEQRGKYEIGFTGFHWRELDEDISFESFEYEDAVPSMIQRFFLEHREINVAEFAKRIDINATLLRNYINGFKKPSSARERQILDAIHQLGREYISYASLVDGYSTVNSDAKSFKYLSDSSLQDETYKRK